MDRTYRDYISGSAAEKRLMTVTSIVQWLRRRLMSLLHTHHTSSVTYRPCCKRLNQGKKPFDTWFSILDNEKTLQIWGNASSSGLNVASRTLQHEETHFITSWWHMLSPPCGPSATNHMNCLLSTLKRSHRNYYCVVPNVFCFIQTTGIPMVINVVCEVGKSLETPSNVIL